MKLKNYLFFFLTLAITPFANGTNIDEIPQINAVITIADIEGAPGTTVDVPVTAIGFQEFVVFECRIAFNNNVLTADNVSDNFVINLHPAISNAQTSLINDSIVAISWFSLTPASIPDGEKLFDLHLYFCDDLLSCAQYETYSHLNFIDNQTYLSKTGIILIPLALNNGSVYASDPLRILTLNKLGQAQLFVNGIEYAEPVAIPQNTQTTLYAMPDEGYQFVNWTDINGMEVSDDPVYSFDMPEENLTLTANFYEIPVELYTLTVNTVGQGSVTIDGEPYTIPVTVEEGTILNLEALAVAGHEFAGWSGDLTGANPIASILMDGDKEVTATFTEIPPELYTLTVNIVGSGSVTVNGDPYAAPLTFEEGTTVNLLALPEQWWLFDAWSGDLVGNNIMESITMDGDKTITVTFIREQFTLTVYTNGDGSVEVNGDMYTNSLHIDAGTTVSLNALANQGWEFTGWSGALSGTQNPQDLLMDEDKSVTATFEEIPPELFTLTINISGNGTVEVNGEPYAVALTFEEGTTLSLAAIPAEGWFFTGWTGDLIGTDNPASLTITGDKSVTATFAEVEPELFTLTINVEGDGGVMVNGTTYQTPILIEEGSIINLHAIPTGGWQFDGWSGDITGAHPSASILMDSDKEVTATFTEIPPELYTLTVNIVGSGSVTVNGDPYTIPVTVEEGTTLNLEAFAAAGHEFAGWSGDLTGTNPIASILMDSDKAVTATFEEIPPELYTLTVTIVGSGSVTVNGDTYTIPVTVEDGTTLSLTALPAIGWQFDGWSGDLTGDASPQGILMDSDKEVTATFTEIPPEEYTLTVTIVGSGIVTVDGANYTVPVTVEEGTTLTLEALAAAGHEFAGWSGDLTGDNPIASILMDSDKEVTATFEEIPPEMYTVVFNVVGGNGSLEAFEGGETIESGDSFPAGVNVQFVAEPDEGFKIKEWRRDGLLLVGYTLPELTVNNLNQDVIITVEFEEIPSEEYTLTVNTVGSGTVTVNGDAYTIPVTVEEGTTLNLVALPAQGYGFVNWTDANGVEVSDEAAYSFTMPAADLQLTANFVFLTYNITFIVTDTCSEPIENAIVSLNGVENEPGSYVFEDLEPGIYEYTVVADNFLPESGTLSLISRDRVVRVSLLDIDPDLVTFLQDITISPDETECFDAIKAVVTAGYGTDFIVEDGATLELVAECSVIMKAGTRIEAGAHVHAYIGSEFPFCTDKHFLSSDTDDSEYIKDHELLVPDDMTEVVSSACFRIFPNPVRDVFTLELCGFTSEPAMTVEIFDMRGEIIIREQVSTSHKHTYDLSAHPPGIYLVRVIKGDIFDIQRIIKKP